MLPWKNLSWGALFAALALLHGGCKAETSIECETDEQCGENHYCHSEKFVCFAVAETTVPTFQGTEPPSPSNHTRPALFGTSEPDAMVSIYDEPTCATKPLTRVKADEKGAFRAELEVAPESNSAFYAKATKPRGYASSCSRALTYIHETARPTATLSAPQSMVDVPVDGTFTVTFSEPMNLSSVNDRTLLLADAAGPVAGTVTLEGTEARFQPSQSLKHATLYTLSVGADALDVAGNPAVPSRWDFTTVTTRWTAPKLISAPGDSVDAGPVLSVSADGTAFILWTLEVSENLWSARDTSQGQLERIQLNTGATDDGFALAVDEQGNAVAAWVGEEMAQARRYTAKNGWAAEAQQLSNESSSPARAVDVAMNAKGDTAVMWSSKELYGSAVYVSSSSSEASSWTAPELVVEGLKNPDYYNTFFNLAVEPSGALMALLEGVFADQEVRTLASFHRSSSSPWARKEILSPAYGSYPLSFKTSFPSGLGGLVWRKPDAGIAVRLYSPETGWSSEVSPVDVNFVEDVELAIGPRGHVVITWLVDLTSLWVRLYDPDSGWKAPEEIAPVDGAEKHVSRLAIDKNGNAIVLWQEYKKVDGKEISSLIYNRNIAGRGWEGRKTLVESEHFLGGARLGMDAQGAAIAAWQQNNGPRGEVWLSRLPLPE